MTIRTRDEKPPTADTPQPTAAGYRRTFEFRPEPDSLLQDIRLSMPRGTAADYPAPAFYDNALDDGIATPYRQRTYIPLEHSVEEAYVHLVLAAGDYPGFSPAGGERAADQPAPSWGQRLRARVNDIGANIWWKVGLPNEKLEDDHFTVLYNTREHISGAEANIVLQSLRKTRRHFQSEGYTVPDWVIVTLHMDNTIEGSASGLGRAMHWKMTLGAWQAEDDLRSAAAHELFHIIQYENMSYAARALKSTWAWWMEGTAVWAETVIHPGSNSAADWVKEGSDFIHHGMHNYGSLSWEQSYACVALVTYLEANYPGAVLQILKALGVEAGPTLALSEEVGGLPGFFFDFATTYLSQKEEPFKSWDLSKAVVPVTPDAATTFLVAHSSIPAYSARGFKLMAGTSEVPVSFSAATGSVLRSVHPALNQATIALDASGAEVARISSLGGTTTPEAGALLPKADTFTAANPLRVIHINYLNTTASAQVIFEVPTLNSARPERFDAMQAAPLQAHGLGFGPVPGKIEVNSVDYAPDTWGQTYVFKSLPGGTVSPGPVSVRVYHAAGVYSNTRQVMAE